MIAWLCTALVGGAFLFSAFVKAVDGRTFLRDLARYRLLPTATLPSAAALCTGAEAALGTALVMHVAPSVVVPAAAGLVIALAGLTLWAERARDLEDCGCYGGVVLLTPRQSAALDGAYLALLGTALWMPAGASWAPVEIGLGATVLVGGAAGVAAWHSLDAPLVDLSRLRTGRRWKTRWLPSRPDLGAEAPHFLVFLTKDCPYCKRWVPLLNVMNSQPDFPDVVGVMAASDEEMEAFRGEHVIHFPVEQMERILFERMVTAYPTAVHLDDRRVTEKWTGEFPERYLQRVRQFYESVREASATSTASSGFGG